MSHEIHKNLQTFAHNYCAFVNSKMLGIVTGALQHKDTKKCVNFGEMSNPPYGTCSTHRGAFVWCIDHLMKLDTSNCATVSLETNGRIKESGWCVHMYQERDVFKVYIIN